MNNLLIRSITGIFIILILTGAILWSPLSFTILFFIITLVGVNEFYNLISKTGYQPQKKSGIIISGLIFLFSAGSAFGFLPAKSIGLLFPLLFIPFILELYTKSKKPFVNIGITILGIMYVALPFSLLPFLLTVFDNDYTPLLLIGFFILLWTSDSLAYVCGRLFGKHKLFERVSPKKTWEGSIGGAIFSLISAYILSVYFDFLTFPQWAITAIIISVIGNIGDLTESLLKRSVQVKDSGNILPGHGGILDRFDSLLLATPFLYAYLNYVVK